MYSEEARKKASKGSVQITVSHSRLQLRFRVQGISKRFNLSMGLSDTPTNRKAAEQRARQIELDIASGNFDPTLAKYKPEYSLSIASPDLTPKTTPKATLDTLWEKFIEYKRPQCSPSTMRLQYKTFTRYLNELPTRDLDEASIIRDHILKKIPIDSAKRFIIRLSACCNWAMKSGWITENPFQGMASEIKLPKGEGGDLFAINPFSTEEREAILEALLANTACSKFSRVKHSHYYPFVFFLFNTGARPSEVIALQWKHISDDFRSISFVQAVVESDQGAVCKHGLKTQERRRFPCNEKMRGFLKVLKPKEATAETLVFPSPTGKWIDSNNFRNRIWTPVLDKLSNEYRKLYQTRHTFITLALENGLDAKDVARLVGNSPEIIYRHYAGNKRDLCVPVF